MHGAAVRQSSKLVWPICNNGQLHIINAKRTAYNDCALRTTTLHFTPSRQCYASIVVILHTFHGAFAFNLWHFLWNNYYFINYNCKLRTSGYVKPCVICAALCFQYGTCYDLAVNASDALWPLVAETYSCSVVNSAFRAMITSCLAMWMYWKCCMELANPRHSFVCDALFLLVRNESSACYMRNRV